MRRGASDPKFQTSFRKAGSLGRLRKSPIDLRTAEARATQALDASQRADDLYYVPRNLTMLADVKASAGDFLKAHELYKRAEGVIDSMLITVNEPYWRSSIAGSRRRGRERFVFPH